MQTFFHIASTGCLFLVYLENEVDADSSSETRDKPTDCLSGALALKNETFTTQL